MARQRITKQAVDKLVCAHGRDRTFMWDSDLVGFGVAALASGKKTYCVQFRKDGRSRRVGIGDHGRLTPDEARSRAKIMLGAVENGADPVEDRRKARAVRTFREVAEEFMLPTSKPKLKGSTRAAYRDLLDRVALPALGGLRMADIQPADIARLHAKWASSPYTANRAVSLVSSIWSWAARARKEVTAGDNPAKGVDRNRERKRERYLSRDELGRLGETLREAETTGLLWNLGDSISPSKAKHRARPENRRTTLDPYAVAAIRLLILTGARLGEILSAKWQYVDLERGIIHLPDSKTGPKPIYLSAAAQAVIQNVPKVAGNPYLIAGERDGAPRSDLKKPWRAVTRAAKLDGLRLHDLRHSFASLGAGASLGLPLIGKLLGHTQPATTARYAHLDADPLRRAVDTIGATIEAAMSRGAVDNVAEHPKARDRSRR